MNKTQLILRSLAYYWRTNAAVAAGVATAVAVLTGALLVGDSVRGSLRDLVLQRLGRTQQVIVSTEFFREALAAEFEGACPIIVTQGFVSRQGGGGRAGDVRVYGVDDRFWQFHNVPSVTGPSEREAFVSEALARELAAMPDETILIRVQRPSDIPLESLHARKDEPASTLTPTVRAVLSPGQMGDFSLDAQQSEIRAVFVPLRLLQSEMEIGERINAIIVAGNAPLAPDLRDKLTLEDLGMRVRALPERNSIALEAAGGLLDDAKANAALDAGRQLGLQAQPMFTYLVNSLRIADREIPYSLVTAAGTGESTSIILNEWAARDLNAKAGDRVILDYYVWEDPGRLANRTSEFQVTDVVPVTTGDRDMAPVYPGITESTTLSDWDPPFPIDLRRVRKVDEDYWEKYRTTPKAFISLNAGQQLWKSRYGALTSIRFTPASPDFVAALRTEIDPLAMGIVVTDVRNQSLAASRGATNFGEYFVYFSFFLVVSALLLAALFFKLSVEQRSREVGLLRAVGFGPDAVRRLFIIEGLALSAAGALAGMAGGIGYAYLLIVGLGTWWVDAVGTSAITLHISPVSLLLGTAGGILAALVCIWITLRRLKTVSERRLLAGQIEAEAVAGGRRGRALSIAAGILTAGGVLLMAAAAAGVLEGAGGFFGAGALFLTASLCAFGLWFRARDRNAIEGHGWRQVSRLGMRNATYRPSRSVLSIATIAAATFILISVDSFRRDGTADSNDRNSGTGGYSLLVNSMLPIVNDPTSLESASIEPFRLRPGDDASCLNLYEPRNPRILAAGDRFIARGRFAFQDSLASTDAERSNPWLLLHRTETDGAVPVIADANSMAYVLHRSLGEDIVIDQGGHPIRLRLVAALDDSIFQGELLMSESNFLKLFPGYEGYRFLLVETPHERAAAVSAALEDSLADFGADAKSTSERLAEFHRVENTYLSTFQMLGALGLLLGTVGLGAVLLRNVLERRRELAMLRALGYRQPHFFAMAIAENALLLFGGLITGALCALLAIAPVVMERGGRLPAFSILILLFGVLAAGLITSLLATAIALRSPLLETLRSE